jgi:NAD(P)-dependent dehydrogenase (short-subunit alcohol dehydrogenase family)
MPRPVALVTGCSSGFGRLLVEPLARAGYLVYATMRDIDRRNALAAAELTELRTRQQLDVQVAPMDVTSDSEVEQVVRMIERQAGRVDVLVNNAGCMSGGISEAFSAKEFEQLFQTNVIGLFRVTRAVLPMMRRQHSGLLVHMSAAFGRVAPPFFMAYTASKAAVEAIGESLRYELAPFGIDSVIVEPSVFQTRLITSAHRPADGMRAIEYGSTAAVPGQLFAALDQMFDIKPDETDPHHVVGAILDLIAMRPGERPLRTVVGAMDFGAAKVNQATASAGRDMLAAVGLQHLESVTTARATAAATA